MISIAQRLIPFSLLPNTSCLIPGTPYKVVVFHSLAIIYDLNQNVIKKVKLDIKGPLKRFTVEQNLERGCVTVWSEQFRYHILPNLEVVFQKNPNLPPTANQERLSFGVHKKQEWEQIRKRRDFQEIFPLWFRLGRLLKLPPREREEGGMFSLLQGCREAIESHRPETIFPAFEKLFLAGFEGMFVPRLKDEEFQGILPPPLSDVQSSPLYLLQEGAQLIRSLFVSSLERGVALLPHLPPECFAGRFCQVCCSPYGELDLEWSKKQIRSLVFRARISGEITFQFPPSLHHFRVRLNRRDRGKVYTCGETLEIKLGSHYLLDQFQK